ncbi:hypothetical protein KKC13_07270 [bacterium]|nr:hypothetical protein [bacterium]MBU1958935.1 hypothetical protein [bacterium]
MQYYLALLIGSQLDIGILYLVFILYVFVQRIIYRDTSFVGIQWQYLFILVLGIVSVMTYIVFNDPAYDDMSNILLNIRKYFIEIMFSIALYDFLKYKDLKYTLNIIYISVIINILVGTYEIVTLFPERIDMLFSEPSAAGYYYLFVFFILYEKFKQEQIPFYVSRYFMVLGLAIGSKAQIALLALVAVLRYATPLKIVSLLAVVGTLIYAFRSQLMDVEAIAYNMKVLNIYLEEGLSGLRTDNGVWGTYVTRISAIQGAIICFFDYPFGIGFGGYNSWYVTNMVGMGFSSSETDGIFAGIAYATPKSNLLSFFVNTGIFGLALYFYWFKQFILVGKQNLYLFQSFILLTFASLFIELNPMFVYIMFLFILKEKEEEILQYQKERQL